MRQRHEAAASQLQGEVHRALAACRLADAGLGVVEHDEHRRERALAVGHEQVTIALLAAQGHFHAHVMLREVFPLLLLEEFDLGILHQRRPGPSI